MNKSASRFELADTKGGAALRSTTVTLNPIEARYADVSCRVLMTGVQALARLPLDQARRDAATDLDIAAYISGYEGSPLGGYDLELARQQKLLDEHRISFEPGLNEEAAATAVQGTQLIHELEATVDGVVGYWYGKAPGLDRASDALRHANLMGTHPYGGAVAFVGDDPAAKSSSLPCASEQALADLMMPVFHPSDAADVLTLGRHAVALSRASGLWSSMKIVTAVADGSTTLELDAGDRFKPNLPFGAGKHVPTAKLLQPTLGPLERDMLSTRLRIVDDYLDLNEVNLEVQRAATDRFGIITSGATYLEVVRALDTLGFGVDGENEATIRVLKLGVIWPLHQRQIREFAAGLDKIIVVEEKRSFIETQVRDLLYGAQSQPEVVGKRDSESAQLFAAHGELNAAAVTKGLASQLQGLPHAPGVQKWLEKQKNEGYTRTMLPLAVRSPYFCSGCPHNSSTKPRSDSAFGAGIGCHSMVLLMDSKQVGDVIGLTQMGGEGAQWIGMSRFVKNGHFVQNLGDGTFHHSGSLAIRASIAAGTNITYRILYNSTVAMTGGQDAVGQLQVAQMSAALLAEGVARIIVTSDHPRALKRQRLPQGVEVWDRSRLEEAQRTLAEVAGTTVLIHEQECATELRRKRKRGLAPKPEEFVMINERICEGCGDCGEKSNCLSVQPVATEFGRKTRIHQSSCNLDKSCLDGNCPAFMTVRAKSARPSARRAEVLGADELPTPLFSETRSHRIRLMGIGGTGIVTTSQLVATAAVLAGRFVRTLDRTGLAQKGGAVVSDIAIESAPFAEGSSLRDGSCDLYLGYDLLVAADPANLNGLAATATALISSSIVPTGAMVSDPTVNFPPVAEVLGRITERLPQGTHLELDLRHYVETLFGSEQLANTFLLGAAVQMGALTLPPEAIEQAIQLNGVAVEANVQAFRRGRQFIAHRRELDVTVRALARNEGKVQPSASRIVNAAPGSELERIVAIRRAELIDYQHERYARRYEDLVEQARIAEQASGATSGALAEAVARNLYKLMAYKDEYEVARLALDPGASQEVQRQFGADARVSWRLHPPILKAMGMKRKLALGAWFRPGFVALKSMRWLRGTPVDPFGHDKIRKLERQLIGEYELVIADLIAGLHETTLPLAVQIAELPDLVRGYDDVKLRNAEKYHAQLAELMQQFSRYAEATQATRR